MNSILGCPIRRFGQLSRSSSREKVRVRSIEYSFEDKVDHVIQQLERGEVIVTFDAASETNLIPSR